MRKHGPFFISISEVPVRSDAEKSPEGGEAKGLKTLLLPRDLSNAQCLWSHLQVFIIANPLHVFL